MKHLAKVGAWTLGALVVALIAMGTWSLSDARAPDDRTFRSANPPTMSSQANAFQVVGEVIVTLEKLAKNDAALRRVLRQGSSSPQEEIKRLIAIDAIASLPSRLDAMLPTRAVTASDVRVFVRDELLEESAVALARLLAAITSTQRNHNREEAWRFGRSSLKLCRILQEEASTLHEFVAAHACLTISVTELAPDIRAGGWTDDHLKEVTEISQSELSTARFAAAMKNEYRLLFATAEKAAAGRSFPCKQFSYHPNTTKRQWIDAVKPMFDYLNTGDAAAAFRAFLKESVEPAYPWLGRNAVGYHLLRTALPQYSSPLEQFVTSTLKVPLLQIQAALELHRRMHGRLASRLSDLVPEVLTEIPRDAWDLAKSEFRYSPGARRVYSVGPNAIDDGGRFKQSFHYDQHTDDYGVRLHP